MRPRDSVEEINVAGGQSNHDNVLPVGEGFWGELKGDYARACSPPVRAPPNDPNILQGLRGIPLMEPTRRRAIWDNVGVYLGRGATDFIEV